MNTVILPDGYNGNTLPFFITPLERDATCVKLGCAAPDMLYCISWFRISEYEAAMKAQDVTP